MKHRSRAIIATVLLLINPVITLAQDACKDVLADGIFDQSFSQSDITLASSVLNFVHSTEYTNQQEREARGYAASGGFGPYWGKGNVQLDKESVNQAYSDVTTLNQKQLFWGLSP